MKRSEQLLFFILFLLALAIIFLSQNQIILFFKHGINEILRPFETLVSEARNTLTFWQSAILNIKSLKESNAKLIQENLEIYGKIVKLSQLEEENSLLREQLNLSRRNYDTRLSNIIGRDFQNNRSFLVDKGTNDGVGPGMAVISKGEMLVGRIVDASYNTAEVQTILDTQSRIAAVSIDSKISGLIRGLGSDIIFELIAKNKKPEIGELVISSGTDGIWPRGLIIGKIKQVKSGDNQVFNTADIELLTNISEFNDVFIITNK